MEEDIDWACTEADHRSQPVALVIPPGVIDAGAGALGAHPASRSGLAEPLGFGGEDMPGPSGDALEPKISRREAIRAAVEAVGNEPVIHANGYICRESFAVKDRLESFYMIGSMGLASAIGFGVSLAVPDRTAVIFDGDGNLLMSLGILAMVGGRTVVGVPRPQRLVHVVFDNEVYGSTGNQASPSCSVRLDRLARAAGYAHVTAVTGAAELSAAVKRALLEPGPTFVLVKVTAEEQPAPRIPYSPEEIRDRFRGALRPGR